MQNSPLSCLQHLRAEPPGIHLLSESPSIVLASAPEIVAEVLNDAGRRWTKGALPLSARLLMGDGTATTWFPVDEHRHGRAAITETVAGWRRKKRGAVVETLKNISFCGPVAVNRKEADRASTHWQSAQTVDIYAVLHALLFRVSLKCLFGCAATPAMLEANAIIRLSAGDVNRHLRSRLGRHFEYFDRLHAGRGEMWRLIPGDHFDALRRRRAAVDFLAAQLLGGEWSQEGPLPLHQQIFQLLPDSQGHEKLWGAASIIGLLFASYQNSASAAAWLVWNLATNQRWQDQIALEIGEPQNTLNGIKSQWPTLWNCLQETLRLYPPVWSVGRTVQSGGRLGEYNLTPGSIVIISPWLQHRHSAFWQQPDEFDPTRFAREPNPDSGAFLPFGSGSHSCPAETFARLTVCVVVARWLQSWRFLPSSDHASPQPILGLTQQPQNGVWVQLQARD